MPLLPMCVDSLLFYFDDSELFLSCYRNFIEKMEIVMPVTQIGNTGSALCLEQSGAITNACYGIP